MAKIKLERANETQRMTRKSLAACKNVPHQRWGQAMCNQFALRGKLADQLFNETDDGKVQSIVDRIVADYQIQ